MKKKLITLTLVAIMAVGAAFALNGCKTGDYQPNKDIYAFWTTNGMAAHTGLAFVNIKTTKKGEIETMKFDEAFLPYEWARLNAADADTMGADNVIVVGTTTMPKYLHFDGTMYTGSKVAVGTDTKDPATGTMGVRYFANATDTESFETKLSKDNAFGVKYVNILKNKEYSKIQYGKGANGADKVNVTRAKSTATVPANTVKLGAPGEYTSGQTTISTDVFYDAVASGNIGYGDRNGAYASVFFKSEGYNGNFNAFDAEGNAIQDKNADLNQTAGYSSWKSMEASLIRYVNAVGLANLSKTDISNATKVDGAYKVGDASTGASATNIKGYLSLFVDAYEMIKK